MTADFLRSGAEGVLRAAGAGACAYSGGSVMIRIGARRSFCPPAAVRLRGYQSVNTGKPESESSNAAFNHSGRSFHLRTRNICPNYPSHR